MEDRPGRILVIEDEVDLADGIRENLEAEGHEVRVANDGLAGLEAAREEGLDLVLLDVMLPGLDGFSLCGRLRAAGVQTPVLFLTAKSEPADRIRGLEEGGDDYLAKPFHLQELLLRVAAILRRTRWYREDRGSIGTLRFGGNRVDLSRYAGWSADGVEHVLTHKEAMILKLLAERAGQVVSRDEVLDTVWGYGSYPTSRTVDNFILRLRRRFERNPRKPRHFHTVHGVGYRFTREES